MTRNANVVPPSLSHRFEAFIRTLDQFETIDDSLGGSDPHGMKRADYIVETGDSSWSRSLGTQPWLGPDAQPMIEILVEGLAGGADVPAEVAFREHTVEVGLRGAQPALDGLAEVLTFSGLGIAADVDADHPGARSAADDLASFASHMASKRRKRHTCGTRGRYLGLVLWVV
jgi:hypothetical protein